MSPVGRPAGAAVIGWEEVCSLHSAGGSTCRHTAPGGSAPPSLTSTAQGPGPEPAAGRLRTHRTPAPPPHCPPISKRGNPVKGALLCLYACKWSTKPKGWDVCRQNNQSRLGSDLILACYLHVWHQLTEAVQQALKHRVLLLVLEEWSGCWVRGHQHPEEPVAQQGVLRLPLRLTVQVAQEGGQHGDVGGFIPAENTDTILCRQISIGKVDTVWRFLTLKPCRENDPCCMYGAVSGCISFTT